MPLALNVLTQQQQATTSKDVSSIKMLRGRAMECTGIIACAVGKEQLDVSVGQYVMVAHGRWSRGFELNGETVRTVDPKDVLGIQDQAPESTLMKSSLGHQTRSYEGKVSVGKLEV